MKQFIIFFIVVGNFILETTIFQYISIMGVKPNTFIPILVSFAILGGGWYGIAIGAVGGLLYETVFTGPAGIHILVFIIIGYLAGLFHSKFYEETILLPFGLTFVATFLYGLTIFIVTFFNKMEIPLYRGIVNLVLPEAIYNCILSILVYYLILRLYKYKFMKKTLRFKKR